MTKENALRAYKKAMADGRVATAKDILIRHPEFEEVEKVETKPSKGKI